MKNFIPNRTIEYNDNCISRFIAQDRKCTITGIDLGKSVWYCHHKEPGHLSKDEGKIKIILIALKLTHKKVERVN